MQRTIRTDLAMEAHEYYVGDAEGAPSDIHVKKEQFGNILVTKVAVTGEKGAKMIDKPIGNYITLEMTGNKTEQSENALAIRLGEEIIWLLEQCGLSDTDEALIVGLGNEKVTPDALGPKAISSLIVTRHVLEKMPNLLDKSIRSVAAVSPGVLGTTGIETLEIIRGIAQRVAPKLVIVIDALASRSVERLGNTVQISDTGICPGSGVGNRRDALNKETLGIPVIAIGIPTVVDAATITSDFMQSMLDTLNDSSLQDRDVQLYEMVIETLGENIKNMIVTPKEIDLLIGKMAVSVARGINYGLGLPIQ